MHAFIARLITGIVLSMGCIAAYYAPPLIISVTLAAILLLILLYEWPHFNAWHLTPLYPVLPFIILILLNNKSTGTGRLDLVWIIAIAVSHDTGAYITGKIVSSLSKVHPLCPAVSPGKTWEGFFGGLVCSSMIAGLIYYYAPYSPLTLTPLITFIMIVLALNISAVGGDLFESYLKRRAGLKDSGTLLPGHGGFLDRFDSILFTTTAWFLMKKLLIV